MTTHELGDCEEEYELNSAEWARSILALGSIVVFGVFGFGLAIFRSLQAGSVDWLLISVSIILSGIAGYVLYQIRPRLLSLAVCEEGLFVHERDGDTSILWTDITSIEETIHETKAKNVLHLFIETSGETNLLVNGLTIERFDEFLDTMRQRAAMHDLEWIDGGTLPRDAQ
jgi:hypothetical protein